MTKKKTPRLTLRRLKELLRYNRRTGLFVWIKKPSDHAHCVKVGAIAGSMDAKGYWVIQIDGFKYKAHRLAWLYVKRRWPSKEIDHENTKHSDNRFFNLRDVTHQQNSFNKSKAANTASGYKGVYASSHNAERYEARLRVDGKCVQIGTFGSKLLASKAYRKAAIKTFGEFARW